MELEAQTRSTPVAERHERRKRNRPALSCVQCRSRKIRCDRNEPCASCVRSKIVNCTYEEARRPRPRLWRLSPGPAEPAEPFQRLSVTDQSSGTPPGQYATGSATALPVLSGRTSDANSASTPASQQLSGESGGTAASLAERVRQLEQQLSDAQKRQDSSNARSANFSEVGPSNLQGVLAKTRYFGRSHWMNITRFFPMIMEMAERIEREKNTDYYRVLLKCKNLARSIKAQRLPAQFSTGIGKNMPPEATAHQLVSAYFRTFETVYRILHVPTFWKEYKKYWEAPESVDQAFIVQLQLCMAIGTCFQDNVAALRQMASQWIYEAQFWLVLPPEKSRMTLASLQIRCLLHLGREACGVGGDLTWISAGSLVRTAMFMGFHRDPDNLPKMSALRVELRRRLWASILEIGLQSSIVSGGPPLISPSDFDTQPPSNFDDEQLSESDQFSTVPRPQSSFTQTTVQIALLRSLSTRLAIAQYVNSFRSAPSYDETLRWNSELSTACRALSTVLQPAYDPAGVLPRRLSLFQLKLTEQMVHRFFLALNHPWLGLAQHNPAYYFARKMCVETAFKLYRSIAPPSPTGESGAENPANDFARLSVSGAGGFRSVPLQSIMTIALELFWQGLEDRSFRQSLDIDHQLDRPGSTADDIHSSAGMGSGAAPRAELLEAMNSAVGYAERRIRAGETNVKGYVFFSALLAQLEALQRGTGDAELERITMARVGDMLDRCWELLKELAGEKSTPVGIGEEPVPSPRDSIGLVGFDDAILGFGMAGDWEWEDLAQNHGLNFNFNFGNIDLLGGN